MTAHLIVALLTALPPVSLPAATILLRGGSVLKGDIIARSPDSLVVGAVFGRITVGRDQVRFLKQDTDATGVPSSLQPAPELQPGFGPEEDRVAAMMVREVAGDAAADLYRRLERTAKAAFLDQFWQKENPLVHKYYYGYHLGRRRYSVSEAYFERGNLMTRRYISGFVGPHPDDVREALAWVEKMRVFRSGDPVALCALGYLHLELDNIEEAEKLFIKAIRKKRRFAEARNGRALACLKMHHQKARALELFRETLALDRNYAEAMYAMGICHIAAMGQDRVGLDEYFGKLVDRFPNHHDAHFKLGAFYEALRYYDRAAEAYSRQLTVAPEHAKASERLAKVAIILKEMGRDRFTFTELEGLAAKKPLHYLPVLADGYIERRDFRKAEAAYERYFDLLPPDERSYYADLSLIARPDQLEAIREALTLDRHDLLVRRFWVLADPTPTTPVNERRVEHWRRVHHARTSFSEAVRGGQGWDRRGDVYVRFGKPDHQTWSDFVVFETDAKVAKVKNRLNLLAQNALGEVLPPRHIHVSPFRSQGLNPETTEIHGIPTFPLPRRTTIMSDGVETSYKWESWIYGEVGGGMEVTFIDQRGRGFYEYAEPPTRSRHWALWKQLAPETVVTKITRKRPSIYDFDYGGDPMRLHVATADFRGEDGQSELEVYIGVPLVDLGRHEESTAARTLVEREVTLYDRTWTPAFTNRQETSRTIDPSIDSGPGVLLIDQVDASLHPGDYFLAVQIRDLVSRKIQIFKAPVRVGSYTDPGDLHLSGLEVAGSIQELHDLREGKFVKGALKVVPLPSGTFVEGHPIHLYYEVYNLTQDEFGGTHYRVDYETGTADRTFKMASVLGRLIGRTPEDQSMRISYEHEGDDAWERMHIQLSLPSQGAKPVQLTVSVTDLNAEGQPAVRKSVALAFGK